MKTFRFIFFTLLLVALHSEVRAQIDSVIIDTSVMYPISISADEPSVEDEEEAAPVYITPWKFHAPIGARITATDSTIRWQYWRDWTYKLNNEPGVITYRMGTNLRTNAVQRFAHEPRHQQLYWEGILLNDPVSGTLNWSLIPQHKISYFYGLDAGTHYRSRYYLRQYYLSKPLSRLMYSESKFNNRNLEFEVSHNLSKQTNFELSYWDRRAGGEYPNSEITGRQIFAKISHHLDSRRYLKLNYINNKATIGRPFGYIIPDMTNYGFNRFNTSANQPSAQSAEVSSLLALNFYQREDTVGATDNLHASVFYRSSNRRIQFTEDTTAYEVNSLGLSSRKWWERGNFTVETGIDYTYFLNNNTPTATLKTSNWGLLKAETAAIYAPLSLVELKGSAAYLSRSDGFSQYRWAVNTQIRMGSLNLWAGLSSGTVMPTPQQLYWNSESYQGNLNLQNEEIKEAHAAVAYHFTPDTRLGFRLQHKDISNGIMVDGNNLFANVSSYASQSATAFLEWNISHLEFETSATVHRFTNSYFEPNRSIPMLSEERLWIKGGLYWKGYLFNRAAYVKAGLNGMMSPFRYRADHYLPELDTWQPLSNDQLLPAFNNLNVYISARVRSLMFVLKWNNVLEGYTQRGYFETATYPMSQRHFIFSVRALFRN